MPEFQVFAKLPLGYSSQKSYMSLLRPRWHRWLGPLRKRFRWAVQLATVQFEHPKRLPFGQQILGAQCGVVRLDAVVCTKREKLDVSKVV